MKIHWKKLIICILIPLTIGFTSAYLTRDSMEIFATLNKPPLSPPGWLFPIVWTILYILMGIASYLIYTSHYYNKNNALFIYEIQLIFNFFWSLIFFNLGLYLVSFIWLIILWLLILLNIILFYRINKIAGYLLIPYLLWVTFAGYLNFMIYLLN